MSSFFFERVEDYNIQIGENHSIALGLTVGYQWLLFKKHFAIDLQGQFGVRQSIYTSTYFQEEFFVCRYDPPYRKSSFDLYPLIDFGWRF